MSTKVSVLIPCHNAERWIGQAIESALTQSLPPHEVIVIDDGSSDTSPEIIRRFGNRIHFIARTNRGSNPTRNELLSRATGDWIQYLDADDYLEPDKLQTQLAEATAQAEVLFSPVIEEIWTGHDIISRCILGVDAADDLPSTWLKWQLAQTGTVLWQRKALERIGGWREDQACCQDNEIMLRAICEKLAIEFTPSAHAVYRAWSESTLCRNNPDKVIAERTRLMDMMLDWLKIEGHQTSSHRAIAGQASLEMARSLAKQDVDNASNYLKARQRHYPVRLAGDAAPLGYRAIYHVLGFRRAEQLAHKLRSAWCR